ncbi:hypothetical protein C8J57DRAFT_1472705 [Mycena rebaudengoi]|nr:hypothetical protein C8J57DRAFT_1472705 [Mycena rebaudengoi]
MNSKVKVIRGRKGKETRREAYSAHDLGVRGCNERENEGGGIAQKKNQWQGARKTIGKIGKRRRRKTTKKRGNRFGGPRCAALFVVAVRYASGNDDRGEGSGERVARGAALYALAGCSRAEGCCSRTRNWGEKRHPVQLSQVRRAAGDDEGRVLLPGGRGTGRTARRPRAQGRSARTLRAGPASSSSAKTAPRVAQDHIPFSLLSASYLRNACCLEYSRSRLSESEAMTKRP